MSKNTREKTTILYMGCFELPDKNAAAQRVIGNAKALRSIGYNVLFLNTPEKAESKKMKKVTYLGFTCYEMERINKVDHILIGRQAISAIKYLKPNAIIAYNYPAIAMSNILLYCKKHSIKCYADLTEWYLPSGSNIYHKAVRAVDTALRMKWISPKSDGIIAISRYLFNYYKDKTKTILIPPLVDITEKKWNSSKEISPETTSFIYAGSPDSIKERLDLIIEAFNEIAVEKKVKLHIVGITENEFRREYKYADKIDENVTFRGRVTHEKAVELVSNSDWAIVIRDQNLVVTAGFPTKVAEAISCGTPVLANNFSNIFEYLDDSNSIQTEIADIKTNMLKACEKRVHPDKSIFDYHGYISGFQELFETTLC
ncbi:MAG: glycosyltransferase [Butyrivibrio sp.]|nr:glycosyltransferase [Butyrivibrio sp.]